MIARETIYEALFAFIAPLLAPGATLNGPIPGQTPGSPTSLKPFNCISRETIEVQRVDPALQPVLFMDEAVEEYADRGAGLMAKKFTVYFHVGCTSTPGTPAATILNPLLDELEKTLRTYMGDAQQLGLGDEIERAQLAGISVKNLGQNSLDPEARQAVAYVPFEIIFAD